MGNGGSLPPDYFFPNASPASVMLRQKILKKCREDIYGWLNHENGQVAIYDAVNPTADSRRSLAKEFAKHDVQVRNINTHHWDIHGRSLMHLTDAIYRVICG